MTIARECPGWRVTVCLLLLLTEGCGARSSIFGDHDAAGSGGVPSKDAAAKKDIIIHADRAVPVPLLDGGGGFPGKPGLVDCWDVPCNTALQFCCLEDNGSTRIWQCMNHGSEKKCGELRRYCDEAADCPAGQQCWVPWTHRAMPDYSTHCVSSKGGPDYMFQVCKSSTECMGGKQCVEQSCLGYQNQIYLIQSCGLLDPRECHPG